jgi:hypothetical protein
VVHVSLPPVRVTLERHRSVELAAGSRMKVDDVELWLAPAQVARALVASVPIRGRTGWQLPAMRVLRPQDHNGFATQYTLFKTRARSCQSLAE